MVLSGICEGIIAIFLPPLAVLLRTGCSLNFLLNILLTVLGWIPGVIHAWIVILAAPGRREQRVIEKDRSRRYSHGSHHSHHSHRSRPRSGERIVYRDARPPPPPSGYGYAPPPPRGKYVDRRY